MSVARRLLATMAFAWTWCVCGNVAAAIPESERAALIDLYNATNGDGWDGRVNWLGPPGTECTWQRVECDSTQTNVIGLQLGGAAMRGTLPPLGRLTRLQFLHVFDNQLSGSFPSVAGMTALRTIGASNNQFSGALPALTGLTALESIDFSRNRFSGSIPALSGLTQLQQARFDNNQLSGQVPAISGLSRLIFFFAQRNSLSGPIPSLDNLPAFLSIDLSTNRLSGSIPALPPSLQVASFSINQLTGPIPSLAGLPRLASFQVDRNQLTGPIPPLQGLPLLNWFSASENQLSGPIPPLEGLTALRFFSVAKNQLSGSIPSLAGNGALERAGFSDNNLTGPLPAAPASLLPRQSNICGNNLVSSGSPDIDARWTAAQIAGLSSPNGNWLLCQKASNSPQTDAQIYGQGDFPFDFKCTGTPVCTGTYTARTRIGSCSNPLISAGSFIATGMDLLVAGGIRGYLMLDHFVNAGAVTSTSNADGSCSYSGIAYAPAVVPYSGSWNRTVGALNADWTGVYGSRPVPAGASAATFSGSVAPSPFQMSVSAQVDADSAVANAFVTFRPEDLAAPLNVYAFAVAPATIVRNAAVSMAKARDAAGKDTQIQCALAQLSSSGQLVGVTIAQLQAYLTNVFGAQNASVSLLNRIPTTSIAGATFYVGYGPSPTIMVNTGTNRSVVTVPGSVTCNPRPPQKGWWWNPAEGGRGFSIEVRGNHLFFAAFLYDVSGRSSWYVSSGAVSLDGTLYNETLYSARGGQALGGAYPGFPQLTSAGQITLAFDGQASGTLLWPGGTVPIRRFDIVPNGLNLPSLPNQPENGWWWNEQESGRGFFMEWQGNTLDIAGYMYDEQGNPVWYLTYLTTNAPGGATGETLNGTWWSYADGQTLTGPWRPNRQVTNNVAPVSIRFTTPDSALMTLPNGRTTTLRRHLF